MLGHRQGGVEQPTPQAHCQGQHHTVGPGDAAQVVLLNETGEEYSPGIQGVNVDGVAVLGEQLGQAQLAHVAP